MIKKFVVYLPDDGYIKFCSSSKSYTVDEPTDATLYKTFKVAQGLLQRRTPFYINGLPYNYKQFEIYEIELRYKILMKVL